MGEKASQTFEIPMPDESAPLGFLLRALCEDCFDISKDCHYDPKKIVVIAHDLLTTFPILEEKDINYLFSLPVVCHHDGTVGLCIGHADLGDNGIWLHELKTEFSITEDEPVVPGTNLRCLATWGPPAKTLLLRLS